MNAAIVNPSRNNAMSLLVDLLKEHKGEAHLRLTPDGQIEVLVCGQSIITNGTVAAPPKFSSKELVEATLCEHWLATPGSSKFPKRALREIAEKAKVGDLGLDHALTRGTPLDPPVYTRLLALLEKLQASIQPEVTTNGATEHEPDG